MHALVESGFITKIFTTPKGFILNGNQYPQDIFYKWTKAQKEAIGIYEIEMDNTNLKDEKWYINTNITYSFGSGKVVLEATDEIKIDCSVADKLSGTLSIMEIT